MILRAAPAHLPRLSDGSPLVIVSEGVVDPSPIASPALPVWIASARGGGILLHPLGTRAPDPAETAALAAPPAGAVAMVAPEAHALSALARWWEGSAARPAPYVVLAASGAEALGGLLAAVAEALSASLLREAAAARALPAPGPRASNAGDLASPTEDAAPPLNVSSVGPDGRLAWAGARAIEGGVDLVALGDEAPRPLLRAPARERAILLLPGIAAVGTARLRVSLRHGSGRGAAVCAWLLPEGEAPGDLTDLAAPGSAWTGWRGLEEEGALSLLLPAGFGARGYLALGLRAGDEDAVVEVEAAVLGPGPQGVPATPEAGHPAEPPARQPHAGPGAEDNGPPAPGADPAITPPRAPLAPAAPLPDPPAPDRAVDVAACDAPGASAPEETAAPAAPLAGTSHEGVRLKGHEAGGGDRHLDLEVAGLAAGAERWPLVRLKFAPAEGEPLIEFRLTGGWPPVFEEWLGRQSDRHGPFLRVFRSDVADFLELVSDPRDAALIRALLLILPGLVEEGCRQAGIGPGETPDWVAAARALQAGARPA